MALSPEQITDAALRLLCEYGLADLSMRRVAAELDVRPSALYWHVANKQELLVLVARELLVPCEGGNPLLLAHSIHRQLTSVPDAADVVLLAIPAASEPLPALERFPQLLQAYVEDHIPLSQRLRASSAQGSATLGQKVGWASSALIHHVLASAAQEQNAKNLGREADPEAEAAFGFGVKLILSGLIAHYRHS